MLTGCARALVEEDDTRVRTFFEESLAGEGFDVLDADMPAGPNGYSAARVLLGGTLPIILLTAANALEDRPAGSDAGADDYPGKPLSMPALVGPAFDKVLAAAQREAGWARTRLYEWLAPVVAGYLRARGVDDPDDLTSEAFVCVFSGAGRSAATRRSSAAGSCGSPTAVWSTPGASGTDTRRWSPSTVSTTQSRVCPRWPQPRMRRCRAWGPSG